MSTIRKVLFMLSMLFGLVTVFCFVGFKLGYDGLLIIGNIELPFVIKELIKIIIFGLQMLLVSSYVLEVYDRRIWKLSMPMIGFISILEMFYSSFITSGVLPFLYLLIMSILLGDWKKSLYRNIFINIVMLVFQLFSLVVKAGYEEIGHNTLSTYEWLVMSIDLLIVILLIYAIGGEKYYVRRRFNWELLVFPEEVSDTQGDYEDDLAEQEWAKLQGFKKAKAMSILLGFQVLQWMIILFVCRLGNVFVEGLVITTSFIAHGFIIQKRWHSKSLIICTLVSMLLFYVSARVTISFKYSQFFPIIIGMSLTYLLYRVSILMDNKAKAELESKLERLERLESKVEKVWDKIDSMSDLI